MRISNAARATHPSCKECSKELAPLYWEVCCACGQLTIHHALGTGGKPRNGACTLIYSSVVPEAQQVIVKKKLRGYGYSSNGKFCTLRCGYHWALKHVK